jgi:hypothetical protein
MRKAIVLVLALAGCGGDGASAQCGDGVCNGTETHDSCCSDCGCVGDKECKSGQCVAPAACGDGTCNANESQTSCCEDCGCPSGKTCDSGSCVAIAKCGDGVCNGSETKSSCCEDCGCASGSSCKSGSCQPDPYCGDNLCNGSETQTSCCDDCGCPSGSSCKSGSCQLDEVCGNGVCGVGEDTDNCCQDCGCNLGYTCAGSCVYVGTSTMNWTFYDYCNDGQEVDFRLFDFNAGRYYPSFSTVYSIVPLQSSSTSILCSTGDKICFGGRQPGGSTHWGVDLDGSQSCTNCCYTCGAGDGSFNPSCP